MPNTHASTQFVRQLRHDLRCLYDPVALGKSPLVTLLDLGQCRDSPSALRQALTAAIQALEPGPDVPPQANAWRAYHILSQRYSEQFTQNEVAANLGLSTRQLGRLERQAVLLLADRLWAQYGLDQRPGNGPTPAVETRQQHPAGGFATPSRDQELEWLRKSCPSKAIDGAGMIQSALEVAGSLARSLAVQIDCTLPDGLPRLAVEPTTVRQAMLNIMTEAIRWARGNRIQIETCVQSHQVWIDFLGTNPRQVPSSDSQAPAAPHLESLEMARTLVAQSGGEIKIWRPEQEPSGAFHVRMILPTADQIVVLVIDDNADTLRLLERYLAGSRYSFIGTADPQEALALAEQRLPAIIVLDVMLPTIDGWELLGRIREHPKTRAIPVIICTILPQEDLAGALGASDLIRKPITQLAFLAALDQQLDRLRTK